MNAPSSNGGGAPVVHAAMVVTRPDSVEPRTMAELKDLALAAGKTGFFGAKSTEQALIVMMAGRDLGLSYSQALRAFHVIEGKPSLSADGMVAVVLLHRDVCEFFRTVSVDDKQATVETKRAGQPAQALTFTIQDAQRAKLTGKDNWTKYPSRMLLARARAGLARDVYPDLLLGLYDADELQGSYAEPGQPPTPTARQADEKLATKTEGMTVTVQSPAEYDAAKLIEGFTADYEEAGARGTMAELGAVTRAIVGSKLTNAERASLSNPAKLARDKIKAREKDARKEASRPLAEATREAGDDFADEVERAEAEAAERALSAKDGGGK